MKRFGMKMLTAPIGLFLAVAASAALAANVPAAQQPVSLVEPVQLKKWIDNGYKTEKGERVVIVDAVTGESDRDSWFAGNEDTLKTMTARRYGERSPQYRLIGELARRGALGHIPGALLSVSHAGYEVTDRNDGPLEAEHEIGSGPLIDKLLRNSGITRDDVIVITSAKQSPWTSCPPRLWWTLYYWGFSPEKIKLLHGGNMVYALAGYALQKGTATPAITPSTISVSGLSPKHFDSRVGLGEMISLVDGGKTTNGEVVLLDVRQPASASYLKDARKAGGTPGGDGTPDIFQVAGYRYDPSAGLFTREADKAVFTLSEMLFSKATTDGKAPRVSFSGGSNPPTPFPNPYMGIEAPAARTRKPTSQMSIPIGAKSASFEGIIKGARITTSPSYDITVPALTNPDNRYKSRAELLALFAQAGIDGTKPIIVYCNSGSLSSFYKIVLKYPAALLLG